MKNDLANLIEKLFCSDQTSYITQQATGKYARTYGRLTASKIELSIANKKSIGSYQKNQDSTVRWICFDFDVAKQHVGTAMFGTAIAELNLKVDEFCHRLSQLGLRYLLEFSGNRGMHIWVMFSEDIEYSSAYDISRLIIDIVDIKIESSLVLLDIFPATRTPSEGVGIGVKLPLSKHTKSGTYSLLLATDAKASSAQQLTDLSDDILEHQLSILRSYVPLSRSDLERCLGKLECSIDETSLAPLRIKSITTSLAFSFDDLMSLWRHHKPLAKLADHITEDKSLLISERKILVGILTNVSTPSEPDFGKRFLHKLFSKIKNYDKDLTEEALRTLSRYNFPSQEQIELAVGENFGSKLSAQELLNCCIPQLDSFEDSTLEINIDDVEVVRKAEYNYILQNDEVYSAKVLNEISNRDGNEFLSDIRTSLEKCVFANAYTHFRNEVKKIRRLLTLDSRTRVITSSILNQLVFLLKFKSSPNSHGYQVNHGFKDGYVFKPWLNLWVKFVANISAALEDADNKNFYIVKTDIGNFYDSIPHENLKRLLMGGVNKKIDKKISEIPGSIRKKYEKYLEVLFKINASLIGGDRGLPQGPAYARFLAELYLDNIDSEFDDKLNNGDIYLYQRYVDDIFFICETEEIARKYLNELRTELQTLGLEINDEKTIVASISDFNDDFKKFASQSKYVVDKASKSFETATTVQKNLAITEFMQIVQADSCEDDLAFIFSHLSGVEELDRFKQEKVLPTLNSGIGRGSMLRHLFSFVLGKENRWGTLLEVKDFNALQSEVLTSVLLARTSDFRTSPSFVNLINSLVPKLNCTPLVNEHLVFLSFECGIDTESLKFEPAIYLSCLASHSDPKSVKMTEATISTLSLTLNAQQSMGEFVDCIYPLCVCQETPKASLNRLAQTFYSKISNDFRLSRLDVDSYQEMQYELPATKFYHLLCLFSLSNQNENIDVLKAAWKYATDLFNLVRPSTRTISSDEWFAKLPQIDVSQPKNNLIISSIVDGSMYRGGDSDKKGIFENFHNLLIIFISGNVNASASEGVDKILDELKLKADFYKWILEKESVVLFPNNHWFEKNVCENDIIVLRKSSYILVRRPTKNFVNAENIKSEHNGYSERIERYEADEHTSVVDALTGLTVVQKIQKLIEIVEAHQLDNLYPNIYSYSRLIEKNNFTPFTVEVKNLPHILFEDSASSVSIYTNSVENFIRCFFKIEFDDASGAAFRVLREKYINNLQKEIDICRFIKLALRELEQIIDTTSESYLDFALASALYLSLSDQEFDHRIKLFAESYEKFNKTPELQHIFCVNIKMVVSDDNPSLMLDAVIQSLKIVTGEVMPSSTFNLDHDIAYYKDAINDIVASAATAGLDINLRNFAKTRLVMLPMESKIELRDREFDFVDVSVLNVKTRAVESYENRHFIVLKIAQHVYFCETGGRVYLLPILPSISKIYLAIKSRYELLRDGRASLRYPIRVAGELDISILNDFDQAVKNVSVQRDIPVHQAQQILRNWLISIPLRYRSILCTLIAAHVVMSKDSIENFLTQVETLLDDCSANIFFLKRVGDVNGTHRLLIRRPETLRRVEEFGPLKIARGAERATLAVDVLISGSQIVDALRFYVLGEGIDQKYYLYSADEIEQVANQLKQIKTLHIAQVFYTKFGIQYIQDECRKFLNPEVVVVPVGGKDISSKALFGKTDALSARQKDEIRNLLDERNMVDDLFNHLHIVGRRKDSWRDFKKARIDQIDLVARYQSLTKKCFYFLHSGTLHNPSCTPFIRTREVYELLNGIS